MKDYLLEKKEDIKELNVKPREVTFEEIKSVAQSIIGPRRAGKSFSLFFWIKKNKIKDEDYIYINFEDDEIVSLKREEKIKIIDYHIELYGKEPKYIFLDEVQNLERWKSFIYSLIEKKRYIIFITGSTSKLLSKELATELRGRTIDKLIFPLSFREILMLKKINFKEPLSRKIKAKIKHELHKYLLHTGFPQVVIDGLNPKQFFKDYYELMIFKDIIERYDIENVYALKYILSRLISNFSCKISLNKIYNEMKSQGITVGKGTVYSYTSLLESVLSIFLVKKFSFSEKIMELSIPKVYLCDNGLANYLVKTKVSEDIGKLMENIVFIELKKSNKDIFYFETQNGYEVDFLVKEGLRIKQLIQVTYANNFDEVDKREWRALLHAYELFKSHKPELIIITWDYEDERKLSWFGKEGTIKFIPLWKWLLCYYNHKEKEFI